MTHDHYSAAERQRDRQITIKAREAHLRFLMDRGASADALAQAQDRFAAADRENIARSVQARQERV